MSLQIWIIMLIGVIFNAMAQIIIKFGVNQIGSFAFTWNNIWRAELAFFTSPIIICGALVYLLSLSAWALAFTRVEVSVAYPIASLGFIVNAFAAYYLLNENLSITRISGILVILFGVYLVSRS